jgi:phage-related protein
MKFILKKITPEDFAYYTKFSFDTMYHFRYIVFMEKVKFKLQVKFYITDAGNEPVRDWLKSLSKDERQIIGEDIKTVQIGWPLGIPLVEKIDKDLWEVRSNLPSGWGRVIFTLKSNIMVLLHGFYKKSNKIPPDELKTAKNRLKILSGKKEKI